jgi:hypothetical protein|tara:strand:+ start:29860 stop:30489 length:630 start_codon:yes stop_codon:yes gene_type:complete
MDENIKIAFSRVKTDIDFLKQETKENKKAILEQKELLKALNTKIDKLLEVRLEKKENSSFFETSSGNEGVDNNRQQSTVNNGQWQTMIQEAKQEKEAERSVQTINEILKSRFDSLTDREFATYVTIYDLEKEKIDVTYADVALRLKLSESSVRSHISHLLTKKVPLTRERYFNGRSLVFIKKGFKDPEMLSKLIKMRQRKNTQTTLFDI